MFFIQLNTNRSWSQVLKSTVHASSAADKPQTGHRETTVTGIPAAEKARSEGALEGNPFDLDEDLTLARHGSRTATPTQLANLGALGCLGRLPPGGR